MKDKLNRYERQTEPLIVVRLAEYISGTGDIGEFPVVTLVVERGATLSQQLARLRADDMVSPARFAAELLQPFQRRDQTNHRFAP